MISVWIKFQSERVHSWPDAPPDVLHVYLRQPHRHLFHIRVEARTTDPRRQVSFERLRYESKRAWEESIPAISFLSCEEMAMKLGQALLDRTRGQDIDLFRIDVSEDGESGGAWTNEFWVSVEEVEEQERRLEAERED